MFHNLYLSTQPPPLSSLSTFIAHISQSLSLSTAPLSSSSLIPQPFSQPPLNIFISHLSQPFFKASSTIFLSFSLSIVD
ncbi:hypothetical protein NC652_000870 [Populus alba x Populus x berolinensis]|nr:hypothetical protein NC652_000870 [Populus alba x Populus x berolinensis]